MKKAVDPVDEFFDTHIKELYLHSSNLCKRYGVNVENFRDLTNEAFLVMRKNSSSIQNKTVGGLISYFKVVVRNKIVDSLRKKSICVKY